MSIEAGVNLALLCILVLGLVRVINSKSNPIEWWHYISSKAPDGHQWGDIDKLGKMYGIIGSTWIVCWMGYLGKLGWEIFAVWLIFIAGVSSFALWVRAFLSKRYANGKNDPVADATSAKATMTLEMPATPEKKGKK